MVFTKDNSDLFYTVNVHDHIFDSLYFDREGDVLTLSILDENGSLYKIRYHNTAGYLMSAGDYWLPSPHIFDVGVPSVEQEELLPFLKQRRAPTTECKLDSDIAFFESYMQLTSGDILLVVCESIEVER